MSVAAAVAWFMATFKKDLSQPDGDPAWAWVILLNGLVVASVLGGLSSMLRLSAKRMRLEIFMAQPTTAGAAPRDQAAN